MTYQEYMSAAHRCTSESEAETIISEAAQDWTITARQFENIRLTAIINAYK